MSYCTNRRAIWVASGKCKSLTTCATLIVYTSYLIGPLLLNECARYSFQGRSKGSKSGGAET